MDTGSKDGNFDSHIHIKTDADTAEAVRLQAFNKRISQAAWVREAISEKLERDGELHK